MVAGSLTYTSLLAFVPLFTVTLVLTSHIPIIRNLIDAVKVFALKNLVPDVGGRVVTVYMEEFSQNAAKLTIIGLMIVIGIAVALMFTIDRVFNDIWRAKRRRSWWKRLAGYVAVLAVGPLLIGASLTLTSYMAHWSRKFDGAIPFLEDWPLQIAPFVLTTLALAIAYRVMPARHVPIRHAFAGGLLAALLFEIVKHLFVVYVMHVPTYDLVYGAFASVPIFLLWVYCCWTVVLVGAEIAATLSYFRQGRAGNTIASPHNTSAQFDDDAMRILEILASSECGQSLETVRVRAEIPIDVAEDLLYAMVESGRVLIVRRGRFQLSGPRNEIQTGDVARVFVESR